MSCSFEHMAGSFDQACQGNSMALFTTALCIECVHYLFTVIVIAMFIIIVNWVVNCALMVH